PALRGDAHPDVHDLREAGLGGDVAAAPPPDVPRERLRRLPASTVPDDDPQGDGRIGRDRWGRPAPDARLDPSPAGVAGAQRRRDLPLRLLVERLLRAPDLPLDETRAAAARGGPGV